jgi:hypothetical protein
MKYTETILYASIEENIFKCLISLVIAKMEYFYTQSRRRCQCYLAKLFGFLKRSEVQS